MDQYINPILTTILIAIYWYNTKAQNSKMKTQSDIINDLKEHVKFFDLQKIKEYVELRESEKDKLIEITKKTFQKDFELKEKERLESGKKQTSKSPDEVRKAMEEMTQNIIDTFILEPYVYIASNLVWKTEDELEIIMTKSFPKSKENLLKVILDAQKKIIEEQGIEQFKLMRKLMTK